MKVKFICVLVIILTLLSFNVCAKEKDEKFIIKLSDDYNTLYKGEDATSMANRLGMEPGALRDYFEENGVLMLAVSKDKSRQIRIIEEHTDFSDLAEDISALDDESLDKFAQKVTNAQNSSYEYITNNDRKYIKFSEVLSDSGGSYAVTQYVTICSGNIYRFCFYNSGATPLDEADEVFSDFKLIGFEENRMPSWLRIVFVLGIALFSALSVAMLIGIIKEKRSKVSDEVTEVEKNKISE